MNKYQVWWRGSDLHDVIAFSKREAIKIVKEFYGVKKAPNNTSAIEVSLGYYSEIVKNNREIGINISNW